MLKKIWNWLNYSGPVDDLFKYFPTDLSQMNMEPEYCFNTIETNPEYYLHKIIPKEEDPISLPDPISSPEPIPSPEPIYEDPSPIDEDLPILPEYYDEETDEKIEKIKKKLILQFKNECYIARRRCDQQTLDFYNEYIEKLQKQNNQEELIKYIQLRDELIQMMKDRKRENDKINRNYEEDYYYE
jgi:hypothetical protein